MQQKGIKILEGNHVTGRYYEYKAASRYMALDASHVLIRRRSSEIRAAEREKKGWHFFSSMQSEVPGHLGGSGRGAARCLDMIFIAVVHGSRRETRNVYILVWRPWPIPTLSSWLYGALRHPQRIINIFYWAGGIVDRGWWHLLAYSTPVGSVHDIVEGLNNLPYYPLACQLAGEYTPLHATVIWSTSSKDGCTGGTLACD